MRVIPRLSEQTKLMSFRLRCVVNFNACIVRTGSRDDGLHDTQRSRHADGGIKKQSCQHAEDNLSATRSLFRP